MRSRLLLRIKLRWTVLLLAVIMFSSIVGYGAVGEGASPRQLLQFIDGGQNIRVGLALNVEQIQVELLGDYLIWVSDGQPLGVIQRGETLIAMARRSAGAMPGKVTYRVQVQAAREEEKLQEMAAKLEQMSPLPVHIVYTEPWYKLQIGDFASRAEAEKAQRDLAALGLTETWITSVTASPTGEAYIGIETPRFSQAFPRVSQIRLEPVDVHARFRLNGHQYRGGLLIILDQQLKLTAINVLPLEEYLYGVVSAEMGNAGLAEIEALKAQAVAARTYAVNHIGSYQDQGFDVLGTVQSQAYYGTEREITVAKYAVDTTRGEILVYGGEIPSTVYHSNAGGHTAFPEEVWGKTSPFLRGQSEIILSSGGEREQILGEGRLGYAWKVELGQTELAELVKRLGLPGAEIWDIVVEERGLSGRVTQIRIHTSAGEVVVQRDKIRQALGGTSPLPSTKFELDKKMDHGRLTALTLRGFGYGHGVGMSQAGAIDLALQGWNYQEILQRYYPNTLCVSLDVYRDFVVKEAALEEAGIRKTDWWAVPVPVGDIQQIEGLEFSPDGRRLALAGSSQILVWDSEAPDEWQTYVTPGTLVGELAWLSPTELVYTSVSDEQTVLIYLDVTTGASDVWCQGKTIRSLHFDSDRQILYAEVDGLIQAYLRSAGVWLPLLINAACPAVSDSGQLMAFIRDGKIWMYDTKAGQSWVLSPVSGSVLNMVWSPDEKWLVVEEADYLRVFDLAERTVVYEVRGSYPRWAPRGFLTYARQEGAQRDIYVVKAGQWQELNLTHTDHVSEFLAAWDLGNMRVALTADSLQIVDTRDLPSAVDSGTDGVVWLVRIR